MTYPLTFRKETDNDIRVCVSCGKKIRWDEFCNNFGWCNECMGADLDKVVDALSFELAPGMEKVNLLSFLTETSDK